MLNTSKCKKKNVLHKQTLKQQQEEEEGEPKLVFCSEFIEAHYDLNGKTTQQLLKPREQMWHDWNQNFFGHLDLLLIH